MVHSYTCTDRSDSHFERPVTFRSDERLCLGARVGPSRSSLFLLWVRDAIAMPVAHCARLGEHIDVGIDAAILRIAVADLQYPGGAAGFIDEVVTIGVTASECRAISAPQHFLASFGDQREFALEYPHQFVLMAMPVTLAGPGTRFDDGRIHPELSQARMASEPLSGLVKTRLLEGRRIVHPDSMGTAVDRILFVMADPTIELVLIMRLRAPAHRRRRFEALRWETLADNEQSHFADRSIWRFTYEHNPSAPGALSQRTL